MLVPHIVEPREDTGLNNGKLGIWFFLASEVRPIWLTLSAILVGLLAGKGYLYRLLIWSKGG